MNKSASKALMKLLSPLVYVADRLNSSETPLQSATAGATVGAPIGALYGALFPRSDYVQKVDHKGRPMFDKYGDPIYEEVPRGRLGEAFRRGATGFGIGGGLGGLLGVRRSMASMAAANDPNRRGPTGSQTKPMSPDEAKKIKDQFKSFKLPKDVSLDATFRDVVSPYYSNVEGGFDAALDTAQKYKDEAKKLGLIPTDKQDVDVPIRITNKPEDWESITRPGAASKSTYSSNNYDNIAGITKRTPNAPYGSVFINPIEPSLSGHTMPAYETLGHELTHAATKTRPGESLMNQNPVLNSKQVEALKGALTSPFSSRRSAVSPNELDTIIKYVSYPTEFAAHLSEAKRNYSRDMGRPVVTPADAQKVLDYYLSPRYQRKTDMLQQLLPLMIKDKDLKNKALMQILSIVRGSPAESGAGMA